MAIAFSICVTCLVLGWPFVNATQIELSQLQAVPASGAIEPLVRALLPGVLGAFFWSVAFAFFLFTLIKIDFKGRSEHIGKLVLIQTVGRAFLFLTVPVAVLWIVGNVIVGG